MCRYLVRLTLQRGVRVPLFPRFKRAPLVVVIASAITPGPSLPLGERGEAPPVAEEASLFRGSGTIGGHE